MYGSCKYIKGDLGMKKLSKIVALCLATTFLFSACSKGGSNESKKDDKKVGIQDNLVVLKMRAKQLKMRHLKLHI